MKMVIKLDGIEVEQIMSEVELLEKSKKLRKQSEMMRNMEVKHLGKKDKCLYVGQREMAVVVPGEGINMLGSEDATTCHIATIRENTTAVTGLAHLDRENPQDFLDFMREIEKSVRRAGQVEKDDYVMTIIGGFDDKRNISRGIRRKLLEAIQKLPFR